MQADPSAQRALLLIADLDNQASQVRHRKQTLPEHAQLKELAAQRGQLTEQVVAAETRLGDAQAEQERIESDLAPARARLQRNQTTIDAGTIAPKALQAMIEETQHLKGRIEKWEDAQLEAMQVVEDETAVRDDYAARRTEIEGQMRSVLSARDTAVGQLDDQLADLADKRERLVGSIPADLVATYDRVAQRNGTGAAELRAGRCTGCGLALDNTELKKHATAAADAVLRCEECGRILVRTEHSGL